MVSNEDWNEYVAQHRRWVVENPRWWFRFCRMMHWHRERRWFLDLLNYMGEVLIMRGKNKQQSAVKSTQKQWTEFVELPVGEAHAEAIAVYCVESDDLFSAVQTIAEAGYRVSFSYNPQNDAVICSVTCKDEESDNAGLTYTSFAGDWVTALRVAMYKHFVLTEGKWRGEGSKSARPSFG